VPALRLAPLFALIALAGTARAAEPTLDDLTRDYLALLAEPPDRTEEKRWEVLCEIADLRSPEARSRLEEMLSTMGRADRMTAVMLLSALVRRGGPAEVDAAIRWVEQSRDPLMRDMLHRILGAALEPAAKAHVRNDALRRATPPVKAEIARCLGLSEEPGDALVLLALLREEDLLVRATAMEGLGRHQADRAVPMLLVFLAHEDWRLRDAAARALGDIGAPTVREPLRAALGDEDLRVVESAARGLALAGDVEAVPLLIAGLRKHAGQDLRLEDAFLHALRSLSGKDVGPDPDLWNAWWEAAKGKPYERPKAADPAPTVEGPRYYGFPVRSSRVVFVVDVSRSMGWNGRLGTAQAELEQVIRALPARTRFNVVAYSDTARAWRPRLTPATPSNVKSALAFVSALAPDNGTNSYEALERGFAEEEADTIFFLSDGHPSVGPIIDPDLILLSVRQWNRFRRARVHGVALVRGEPPPAFAGRENQARASDFMERLAAQNDGWAKVIK
jgi:HEAT repeat protein